MPDSTAQIDIDGLQITRQAIEQPCGKLADSFQSAESSFPEGRHEPIQRPYTNASLPHWHSAT
jgi:hypothetical protein